MSWRSSEIGKFQGIQLVGDPEDHLVPDELANAMERTSEVATRIMAGRTGSVSKLKGLYADTLQAVAEERSSRRSPEDIAHEYKGKIEQLQSEVKVASKEKEALKESISELEINLQKEKVAGSANATKHKKLKQEQDRASSELRQKIDLLERLNVALERAFRVKEVCSRDEPFIRLMKSITREGVDMSAVLGGSSEAPSEELEEQRREFLEKIRELETSRDKKMEELDLLEMKYEAHKQAKEDEIRQIHKDNATAAAGRNVCAKEELDSLKEDLRHSEHTISDLKAAIINLENDKTDLETQVNEAKPNMEGLHSQIKSLMEQKANILEDIDNQIEKATKDADEKSERTKQNAQIEKGKMEEEKVEAIEGLKEKYEEKISRMKEKHESDMNEVKTSLREVSAEKNKLEYQLEHLDAGHDHANTKMEHMEADLKNAQRKALLAEERAEELSAHLEKLKGLETHEEVMQHFTEMAVAVIERASSWIIGLAEEYPDMDIVGSNETLLAELLQITAVTFPKVMDPNESIDGIEETVQDLKEKLQSNKASKSHRAMVDSKKAAAQKESQHRIMLGQKEQEHVKMVKLLTEKYHNLLLTIEHAAPRGMTDKLHELVSQAENKVEAAEYEHLHRQAISLIPKEGGGPKAIELKERLEKAMMELTKTKGDLRDLAWEKDELVLEREDLEKKLEKMGMELGMSKAAVSDLKQSNKIHKSRAQAEKEARERGLKSAEHMKLVSDDKLPTVNKKNAKKEPELEPGMVSLQDQLDMANNSLAKAKGEEQKVKAELTRFKSEVLILRGELEKLKLSATSFTALFEYISEAAGDNEHYLVSIADQLLPLLTQLRDELAASSEGKKLMDYVNPPSEQQPVRDPFKVDRGDDDDGDATDNQASGDTVVAFDSAVAKTGTSTDGEPEKKETATARSTGQGTKLFSREQWDHYQELLEKEHRSALEGPKKEFNLQKLALDHRSHKAVGDSVSLQIKLMKLESQLRNCKCQGGGASGEAGPDVDAPPSSLEDVSRQYVVAYEDAAQSLGGIIDARPPTKDQLVLCEQELQALLQSQRQEARVQQQALLEKQQLEHEEELQKQRQLRDEAATAAESETNPVKKAELDEQLEKLHRELEQKEAEQKTKQVEQQRLWQQEQQQYEEHASRQKELLQQHHAMQEQQALQAQKAMQVEKELAEQKKRHRSVIDRLENEKDPGKRAEMEKDLAEVQAELEWQQSAQKALLEGHEEKLRLQRLEIQKKKQEVVPARGFAQSGRTGTPLSPMRFSSGGPSSVNYQAAMMAPGALTMGAPGALSLGFGGIPMVIATGSEDALRQQNSMLRRQIEFLQSQAGAMISGAVPGRGLDGTTGLGSGGSVASSPGQLVAPRVKSASEALAVLAAAPSPKRAAPTPSRNEGAPADAAVSSIGEVDGAQTESNIAGETQPDDDGSNSGSALGEPDEEPPRNHDRREVVQAHLAMLEEAARHDPSGAEQLREAQEELVKELEVVEAALVDEALALFSKLKTSKSATPSAAADDAADDFASRDGLTPDEGPIDPAMSEFDIDQYPVDLQGQILRKLLDQTEADISSKTAELIHQRSDHKAAMKAAMKEAKESSDASLAAALATARNEAMESIVAVQTNLDAKTQELAKAKKSLEEAKAKNMELEETVDERVKDAVKGRLEEFKIEKVELQAANVAITEERKKFKDLYEDLQSSSDHEISNMKARLDKTNERYLELKHWKEKVIGEGMMDAVIELTRERFQYAEFHEDMLKTVDRLLKLVPVIDEDTTKKQAKSSDYKSRKALVPLSGVFKRAVEHFRATADENHTEATRLFELYRDAAHAPIPTDETLKKLMKDDGSMMTLLSQAIVEYVTSFCNHLNRELEERKREVDALTRHCIGMKHQTDELTVAYDSEETANVIRNLREIIREQNLAIQYHVMMFEKTELEGRHPLVIDEEKKEATGEVALLMKALEPSQRAMSPAKQPATDAFENPPALELAKGTLEALEDFVNDEDLLRKVADRIEADAAEVKTTTNNTTTTRRSRESPPPPLDDGAAAVRRDATHLERERVTELIHELFRRVDDMFVRIDNTVRHIFQDSNYRSMLEWGRQAEKKQAAAKLAMEKGAALFSTSLNYRSPAKSEQKYKIIPQRGLPSLGMESAKKIMSFASPQPVKSISKSASKSAARLHSMRQPGHLENQNQQVAAVRVPPDVPLAHKPIYGGDPAEAGALYGSTMGPKIRHGASKRMSNRSKLANQQEEYRQKASAQRGRTNHWGSSLQPMAHL